MVILLIAMPYMSDTCLHKGSSVGRNPSRLVKVFLCQTFHLIVLTLTDRSLSRSVKIFCCRFLDLVFNNLNLIMLLVFTLGPQISKHLQLNPFNHHIIFKSSHKSSEHMIIIRIPSKTKELIESSIIVFIND